MTAFRGETALNTMAPELWCNCLKRNPRVRLRMFCFPYAGGGALAFRTWPAGLPPEVEVCPVQLPGRENRLRERPFTRLPHLIEVLVDVLMPYMQMPFVFFGHSVGALIGFELARELRTRDRAGPLHLFVSARRAPQLAEPNPPMHQLPEADFVDRLKEFNGTPQAVLREPELMALFIPILRADFALLETYLYAEAQPLDCPITAFGGMQDGKATREELTAWRCQTRGEFRLQLFPGGHFYLQNAQRLLLQAITRDVTLLL
jgi:surfactin synthase thioesterase subunit